MSVATVIATKATTPGTMTSSGSSPASGREAGRSFVHPGHSRPGPGAGSSGLTLSHVSSGSGPALTTGRGSAAHDRCMTNNTARIHIARTRRLVAVAASVVALGFGALAVNSTGSAGASPAHSSPPTVGTPTATTTAPAR